jgi:hypothetical protein
VTKCFNSFQQLISTITELPFWNKIFGDGARSLDVNEITEMARFAMDSYHKLKDLYED